MSKASDNARFDEIENLVTSEEYKDKLKAAETTSQLREVGEIGRASCRERV